MVLTESPSVDQSRLLFDRLLTLAITRGQRCGRGCALGPGTVAAIDAIADNHPDADAADITAAYDAFLDEHYTGSRKQRSPRQDVPLS